MKKLSAPKLQLGFTLIELLLVISIIIILVVVGSASYSTARRTARNAQRQSDLQKISTALEEYFLDQHEYPNVSSGSLETCLSGGGGAGCLGTNIYLRTIPKDPLNDSNYTYGPRNDNPSTAPTDYQGYDLSAPIYEGTVPAGYGPLRSPTHN